MAPQAPIAMAKARLKTAPSYLVAIIGGCATLFGFWADYGMLAIGLLIFFSAVIILAQFYLNEDFFAWLLRKYPKVVYVVIGLIAFAGLSAAVYGGFHASTVIDWFRTDFERGPIAIKAYWGSAAPWSAAPPAGASESVDTAFRINGWKRLMNFALVNDPQNQQVAYRQLLYIESAAFDRDFASFVAELELPTSTSIAEAYAFLVIDGTSQSHPVLKSLRTDCLGVDGNKCHIHVSSPSAGQILELFVVVSDRKQKALPRDLTNLLTLRSIR